MGTGGGGGGGGGGNETNQQLFGEEIETGTTIGYLECELGPSEPLAKPRGHDVKANEVRRAGEKEGWSEGRIERRKDRAKEGWR